MTDKSDMISRSKAVEVFQKMVDARAKKSNCSKTSATEKACFEQAVKVIQMLPSASCEDGE